MKEVRKITALGLGTLTLAALLTFAAVPMTAQASTKSQLKKKIGTAISSQTKTTDSDKIKLKKLFRYVAYYKRGADGQVAKANFDYGRSITFSTDSKKSSWTQTYALKMFKEKKGSCYSFAAIYGHLARQATDVKSVRVAVGKSLIYSQNNTPSAHAWTEVKIGKTWYVCDSNAARFATAKNVDYVNYFLKKRSSVAKKYNRYKGVKYITLKKI